MCVWRMDVDLWDFCTAGLQRPQDTWALWEILPVWISIPSTEPAFLSSQQFPVMGAFVSRGSGIGTVVPWCFLWGCEVQKEFRNCWGMNPKYVHISSLCLLAARDVLLSGREKWDTRNQPLFGVRWFWDGESCFHKFSETGPWQVQYGQKTRDYLHFFTSSASGCGAGMLKRGVLVKTSVCLCLEWRSWSWLYLTVLFPVIWLQSSKKKWISLSDLYDSANSSLGTSSVLCWDCCCHRQTCSKRIAWLKEVNLTCCPAARRVICPHPNSHGRF